MWRWYGPVGFWISRQTEQDKSIEVGSWHEPMVLFVLERYKLGLGLNLAQANTKSLTNHRWWGWLQPLTQSKAKPSNDCNTVRHQTEHNQTDNHLIQ